MFEFAWPWVFMLTPLPLLVFLLVPHAQKTEAALKVPFFADVRELYQQDQLAQHHAKKLRWLVPSLLWLAMIGAAAKPTWVGEPLELPASGRDLLLAVDISGSMETPDMVVKGEQIPRVLVVKAVVGEFVKRRESDRLGLILFGSQAYLQAPLTFDRKTVNQLLQEAQLGFAGEKTAIGDAIGLAVKRLQNRPSEQRILILLTDGQNTAGEISPRLAADLAKQANVKIYTIGMGADEMLVKRGLFGNFMKRVNPSAELDESTLSYIAETTGGRIFRARDPQELFEIYTELDRLEPIEQEKEVVRPVANLFYWPLGLAVLLSFGLALFSFLPALHGQWRTKVDTAADYKEKAP